jgi:hypothetical protein
MSLNRDLTNHGHIHRFVVTQSLRGWDVREEEDSTVLRHTLREDWHRVERDVQLFDLRALALKRSGWTEN